MIFLHCTAGKHFFFFKKILHLHTNEIFVLFSMMMGPMGMGPPQMTMPGMPGPSAQPPKPLFPSAVVVSICFKS